MNTYRVKAGTHSQGGKTFETGDLVKSESDLIKAFPGKFEAAGGTVSRHVENIAETDSGASEDEEGGSGEGTSENATKKATGTKKAKKASKWT